jgi:hypothetical protein
MNIPDVTHYYMTTQGLSLRKFAAAFNEKMPAVNTVTHQSVNNWLKGKYRPNALDIAVATITYPPDDWRGEFALQVWEIIMPGLEVTAKEE